MGKQPQPQPQPDASAPDPEDLADEIEDERDAHDNLTDPDYR
jgi:hypothetical protein